MYACRLALSLSVSVYVCMSFGDEYMRMYGSDIGRSYGPWRGIHVSTCMSSNDVYAYRSGIG